MWNERIIEAKKAQGITPKIMSERTRGHLPERTIIRILSGETANPRIDTIIEMGAAVGLSPQELFADTNVVVATETLAEVKETAVVAEAELDILKAENTVLKGEVANLNAEIAILRLKLEHKDEIIALHKYYNMQRDPSGVFRVD